MKKIFFLAIFLYSLIFSAESNIEKSLSKPFKSIKQSNKPIAIKVFTSKTNIHIGDIFDFTIMIRYDKEMHVQNPPLTESLGDFEIIDYQFEIPSFSKDYVYRRFNYQLSIYELGTFKIPSMVIKSVYNETQEITTISSEAIAIKVIPLTKAEEEQIAPVDLSIEETKGQLNYLLCFLLLGFFLLLIGVTLAVVWYYKNKKIPYYIKILSKMDKLKKQYLKGINVEKGFYFEFYQFVVEHLSLGEEVILSSMTLKQMKRKIQEVNLAKSNFYLDFLVYAERVKFAQLPPDYKKSLAYYNTFKEILEHKKEVAKEQKNKLVKKNKKK